MKQNITTWKDLQKIRKNVPLVHNITNYVVMNNTANALLALGASPIMAHSNEEVKDMIKICNTLVINIGTLSERWVMAMKKAMWQAQQLNKAIVLDPVGVGATKYRTNTARHLISEVKPTVIRGNASEIMALAGEAVQSKGVDSSSPTESALNAAQYLNETYGSVICISGATDYIFHQGELAKVENGHPLMTKVTGMGCTATALHGAFLAVNENPFEASINTMLLMGIVGELAEEKSNGPGSLQMHFLDTLYNITEKEIKEKAKIEVLELVS